MLRLLILFTDGVMMDAFHFCGAPIDISWVKATDNTSAKRAASFLNKIGSKPPGPLDMAAF